MTNETQLRDALQRLVTASDCIRNCPPTMLLAANNEYNEAAKMARATLISTRQAVNEKPLRIRSTSPIPDEN